MFNIKCVSSTEKLPWQAQEQPSATKAFKGERVSYQLYVTAPADCEMSVKTESDFDTNISVCRVDDVIVDKTCYTAEEYFGNENCGVKDGYITDTPCRLPDVLVPCDKISGTSTLYITVDIPEKSTPGSYEIKTFIGEKCHSFNINVLDAVLPKPSLPYTQWFHTDCIATAHNVEIYSEKHWQLIEEYIKMAVYTGINMILMPVITPPLDTEIGTQRPNVQLLDVKFENGKYVFGFENVIRWINLCKKCGVKYYEISHLFSQWGAKCTPNIYDNTGKQIFGWDVASDSAEYREFLQQMLPQLVEVLKNEGIDKNTYFHISDEPSAEHIENYKNGKSIVKPLVGDIKIMDALSEYDFYEKGYVEVPVTASDHIEKFLEHDVKEQWIYYCCGQAYQVSNRFIAQPLARTRVMGVQMYKFDIAGFLQWGYNFYNAVKSLGTINPYETTSGHGAWPSGDPFSVYPGKDGPLCSIRTLSFYEGLQDIERCRLAEKYTSKEEIVKLIDEKGNVTFKEYPQGSEYLISLREKLMDIIEKNI